MSLNGKKVSEFTADAYLNGEFVKVSDKDCRGNGVFSSFIRRILLLSARLSWKISRDSMAISKKKGARFIPCPAIPTLCTKPGMTLRKKSARLPIR